MPTLFSAIPNPDHHFDLSHGLFPFSSRCQARNSATIIPSTSPIAPSFLPRLYFQLPIAKGAGFVPHLVFITSVIQTAALRIPTTTHFTHDSSSPFSFIFFFSSTLVPHLWQDTCSRLHDFFRGHNFFILNIFLRSPSDK